jgi:hypothetical protein
MVGYLSFALVTTHTILAPPTNFLLGNIGSLLHFSGYMGNVQQPFELQVMTKFQNAIGDLSKVDSHLTKAPIQGMGSWQGHSVPPNGGGGGPNSRCCNPNLGLTTKSRAYEGASQE